MLLAVKFQLLFDVGGGVVEGHSSAEKVKKSLRVNISKIVLALNKESSVVTIFLFYNRCDLFKDSR